jgi:hypothetical protein
MTRGPAEVLALLFMDEDSQLIDQGTTGNANPLTAGI